MEKSEKTNIAAADPPVDVSEAESQVLSRSTTWLDRLRRWGLETRGMQPVPIEERTDTRYINIFFMWFTMNVNILPLYYSIVTGMLGTLGFGLSLKDCSLLILFFSVLCCAFPAYCSTFGARTGLRQMLISRFAFGYYLIVIMVILNLCTNAGFGIICSVTGGSTLAAVSSGSISSTVGIVIISIIAMVVSFLGIKFLHQYERYSWIFNLVAIIIATGVGGKHLSNQVEQPAASASTIVSYGGVIAGFIIPFSALAADFSVYCHPRVSTWRIFAYTYAGIFFPVVTLMVLGAAIGGATPNVVSWKDGYDRFTVGGVMQAMLLPAGGFGRFVAVLLSLSVIGNLAASIYCISLNFQLLAPFMLKIPRSVFTVVYTVVGIPVSIQAAKSFFDSLENLMYLISYWAAGYVGVIGTEHFVFRRADFSRYNPDHWDQPTKLPTGLAAIGAMGIAFALTVPCMSQEWYTGPIAKTTGDIGFEVELVLSALLYVPLRWVELKFRPI
ncbi:purine-cytosine permease [Fusarium agapanthi]|uniref:Purine-cytosine permease n=1 Tax=Fusarium agapanthi TaxID=1803897 RepID=A0A9P5B4W0_9HYPO|nr:purine-cytosine permease [Fusarium agapanthi]